MLRLIFAYRHLFASTNKGSDLANVVQTLYWAYLYNKTSAAINTG
jgi:hypothetical protein